MLKTAPAMTEHVQTMRQVGKQSLHDLVVRSVPELWRPYVKCDIAINSGSEQNMWAGTPGFCPDVIGWSQQNGRRQLLWIAAVETDDTITLAKARSQWKRYAALDVPFYLIVPIGFRDLAAMVAVREGVKVNRIYKYSVSGQKVQLI